MELDVQTLIIGVGLVSMTLAALARAARNAERLLKKLTRVVRALTELAGALRELFGRREG